MASSLMVFIVAGIGGAIAVLVIAIFVYRIFVSHCRKRLSNKDSDTGSSDPSAVVEMKGARLFRLEELEQATSRFSEGNLIGYGTFGMVYKGILSDGTIVAVKRRLGYPRQEFSEEAAYLCAIHHRNLVTLFGYCQEGGSQMLVSEHLPNGCMCSHLYGRESNTKLEFKQRLSIAIGAAKAGLCYLHGLQPPVLHGNFKTANVMVDENFIAKVSDAGLYKILEKIEDASSSSSTTFNTFRDPELDYSSTFREVSDVYSFGVFLSELISGKETTDTKPFLSNDNLLHWVQEHLSTNDLVDQRLVGNFTAEGMRDLLKLMLRCMRFPGVERPRMESIVLELEQMLDDEITRTTFIGERMETVTLGSQLFTS